MLLVSVHVHVRVRTCVWMHVEVRDQGQASSLIALHLIFRQGLSLNQLATLSAPVSATPALGSWTCTTTPGCYVGAGDLNSGPMLAPYVLSHPSHPPASCCSSEVHSLES